MFPLTKSVLVAALTTFAASQTLAQDIAKPESAKRMEKFSEKFDAADINHDGFLSRDEAVKGLPRIAKHFDAVDTDHDGKLSPQEVAQFLAAKRKAREQ